MKQASTMIYDKSIFSRGILCLFYIYYYVIHSLCISVSLLNTENSSVKHTLPDPKKQTKKSQTNILLDCVSFDDSIHPLFHYKLMQCYNTYFHLDLHFFTNILHWWWELDRYIKSSSANPGSSMRLRSGLIGGQSMCENALWTTLWQLEPNESWRCQI